MDLTWEELGRGISNEQERLIGDLVRLIALQGCDLKRLMEKVRVDSIAETVRRSKTKREACQKLCMSKEAINYYVAPWGLYKGAKKVVNRNSLHAPVEGKKDPAGS